MQDIIRLVAKSARYLAGIAFRLSIMKRILLIFMWTISLSGAIEWENEATVSAVCDNSTMNLHVNFTKQFEGSVYLPRAFSTPQCFYSVPFNTTVTEVDLSLPFDSCGIQIEEVDNKTIASGEVIIQMHNLLDSVYDRIVTVSCEIDNFHPVNETEISNPFEARWVERTWIQFSNGLVLFGEVGEPTESTLYFVVNVRDRGANKDMVVQNCIAHTDKNVTNSTTLFQLSNFYGCSDASAVLPNFTVARPQGDRVSMFAYAPISNFSLIASGGRMTVSCGVTICESDCPAHCNDTESPIKLPLSQYATKNVVSRADGATMPESLQVLNRHNDRHQRNSNRPRRSLGSFFSRIFHWESMTITKSVSEGNFTNVTSTRMAKGKVVTNAMLNKDVLISGNKHGKSNDTLSNSEEFDLDWVTFRFIALMTVSMFITVLACYCCYADDTRNSKKHQSAFIF